MKFWSKQVDWWVLKWTKKDYGQWISSRYYYTCERLGHRSCPCIQLWTIKLAVADLNPTRGWYFCDEHKHLYLSHGCYTQIHMIMFLETHFLVIWKLAVFVKRRQLPNSGLLWEFLNRNTHFRGCGDQTRNLWCSHKVATLYLTTAPRR